MEASIKLWGYKDLLWRAGFTRQGQMEKKLLAGSPTASADISTAQENLETRSPAKVLLRTRHVYSHKNTIGKNLQDPKSRQHNKPGARGQAQPCHLWDPAEFSRISQV